MADVTITNADGTVTTRAFTAAEVAQRSADATDAATRKTAQQLTDGNRTTLSDRAAAALQGNKDFLAIGTPTAAQTTAQVKALTRQVSGLIRLTQNILDATD